MSTVRHLPLRTVGAAFASIGFHVAVAQPSELPPIGIIDFYGLRTISESDARNVLPVEEGDRPSPELLDSLGSELTAALGVHDVQASTICCDASGTILYIGVAERPPSTPGYRESPTGAIALPAEITASAEQFEAALMEAVLSGNAGDDHSAGHSMMDYPPARAIQRRFMMYAGQRAGLLREVLHESATAQHRAIAATVLAYSEDKTAITPHLLSAAQDPDEEVRNNAIRALGIIAAYARDNPELGINIPPGPFIQMLNSIAFGDRNKGLLLLSELTKPRSPELLGELEHQALASLLEMCAWKSWGHAFSACLILQRILGLPDQVDPGDRSILIDQARKRLPP